MSVCASATPIAHPAADEANVWNCRCTLGYEYPEYQNRDVMRYDQYAGEDIEDMTYQEWKESKHPDWKNRR